mmetsp:Transcript_13472/g.29159  ORF Transcript_13472/g.29159 Transcript_13472/m.29159 type:complete len:256 (-) Transcript_13472:80-847(-)
MDGHRWPVFAVVVVIFGNEDQHRQRPDTATRGKSKKSERADTNEGRRRQQQQSAEAKLSHDPHTLPNHRAPRGIPNVAPPDEKALADRIPRPSQTGHAGQGRQGGDSEEETGHAVRDGGKRRRKGRIFGGAKFFVGHQGAPVDPTHRLQLLHGQFAGQAVRITGGGRRYALLQERSDVSAQSKSVAARETPGDSDQGPGGFPPPPHILVREVHARVGILFESRQPRSQAVGGEGDAGEEARAQGEAGETALSQER